MTHTWIPVQSMRLDEPELFACKVCLALAPDPSPDAECPGAPTDFICDFCSGENPRWEYPTQSHMYPGYANFGTNGSWLACQECHDVMERDGDDALTWRVAKIFAITMPIASAEEHYYCLKLAHNKFIEYRTGKPFPFDPTQPGRINEPNIG